MKPIAYILTLLMLFLMAQPMLMECQAKLKEPVPKTVCGGTNGCSKKNKNKKTESKDCERTNACNPFASCSQCQYVAASKFFYPATILQPGKNKIAGPGENVESGFLTDCWHPPEFVSA